MAREDHVAWSMKDEGSPHRVERRRGLDIELASWQGAHHKLEVLAEGERLEPRLRRQPWVAEERDQLRAAAVLPEREEGLPALPQQRADGAQQATDQQSGGVGGRGTERLPQHLGADDHYFVSHSPFT
eukprot:1733454-Prymnesium_polylepis.1